MTTEARSRLAVALDVSEVNDAVRIAKAVSPHVGVGKVGLQLFSAAGPSAVEAIRAAGLDVFLDVKLHDIPNTVLSAARVLGSLGARYLTIHASGGREMVRAAVEGLNEGAAKAGLPVPMTLAVLVLTSHKDAPPELLIERLDAAVAGGSPGIVCAATDLATVKSHAPNIFAVTPGIRLPGGDVHDQARVSTPGDAIAHGADLLVVGRPITAVDDPSAAAAEINAHVSARLAAIATQPVTR
jgi:orotidine-5'-phosphate decarboxylase